MRIWFLLLAIFVLSVVYAEEPRNEDFIRVSVHSEIIPLGHPMDHLTFKMAVFGPSDDIFIWWGHAALIIEDSRWGDFRVFDWGMFYYPSGIFLKDFVRDTVRYSCGLTIFDMDLYIAEDRDIIIYTLNLDREGKEAILAFAENNVLPENRYYVYHQFHDNCATRIRDIISIGTGGQFKAAFDNVPGRFSIRQHIRRFMWFRPFSDWFLSFMLGQDTDEEITVWDEMFLPVEIARNIVDFQFIDDSGEERKLVSSVQIFNSSKSRPPILNGPLTIWPFTLAAGLILAVLFFLVKTLCKKNPRPGRIVWGLSQSLLGLFFGALGCVLAVGLFFLNYDYFQQNYSFLFLNPLLLAITPLGVLSALNKALRINPDRCLRIIWTAVFVAGSITVFIRVLPFFFQQNQSVQGLVLPIAFAFSCIPENMYKLKSLIGKLR